MARMARFGLHPCGPSPNTCTHTGSELRVNTRSHGRYSAKTIVLTLINVTIIIIITPSLWSNEFHAGFLTLYLFKKSSYVIVIHRASFSAPLNANCSLCQSTEQFHYQALIYIFLIKYLFGKSGLGFYHNTGNFPSICV